MTHCMNPYLSGYACTYHPEAPGLIPKHKMVCFFNLYLNCDEKRTKNNQKEAGIGPFCPKTDTGDLSI